MGFFKTNGKIEVIVFPEKLSEIYYKKWQTIGQVGLAGGPMEFSTNYPKIA